MQSPSAVTPDAPTAIRTPLLTQEWLDPALIHRAVEPSAVAGLMPSGTVPDTHDGLTYVGLVAFRMHRVGTFFGGTAHLPNHRPRRPLVRRVGMPTLPATRRLTSSAVEVGQ